MDSQENVNCKRYIYNDVILFIYFFFFLFLPIFDHDHQIMAFYDEPQWAVAGDTFPVGCEFAKSIVFRDCTFDANPDLHDPRYK